MNRKRLNDMATVVEEICKEEGLPLIVTGGTIHSNETVEMDIVTEVVPTDNVLACQRITRRLEELYQCERAGLDADKPTCWIIGIRSGLGG